MYTREKSPLSTTTPFGQSPHKLPTILAPVYTWTQHTADMTQKGTFFPVYRADFICRARTGDGIECACRTRGVCACVRYDWFFESTRREDDPRKVIVCSSSGTEVPRRCPVNYGAMRYRIVGCSANRSGKVRLVGWGSCFACCWCYLL